MEAVHGDRVLGGARLGVKAAGRREHAVDQGRIDADVPEVAEANGREGLVELARQSLFAAAGEGDDGQARLRRGVDRDVHSFVLPWPFAAHSIGLKAC